jgi:hypothetical protein
MKNKSSNIEEVFIVKDIYSNSGLGEENLTFLKLKDAVKYIQEGHPKCFPKCPERYIIIKAVRAKREQTKKEKMFSIPVFKSRLTPGLKNGASLSFNKGEIVKWLSRTNEKTEVKIDSDLRYHRESLSADQSGYEVIFPDGSRGFVDRERIVEWEGKQ